MRYLSILTILSMVIVTVALTGCKEDTADKKQADRTREMLKEADRQIGMPAITNFQERRLAKQIFELRDQADLATYAYLSTLDGKLVFIGRCIGFGLPYSVQYTNPEKLAWVDTAGAGGQYCQMPQADPNGLFMPSGLSATWLMMIDEASGEVRPVYVEPQIVVSPFPIPTAIGNPEVGRAR